jgi:hypothetical protein
VTGLLEECRGSFTRASLTFLIKHMMGLRMMTETERQLFAQAMDEICAEINEEIRRLEEDDQG